MSTASSTSRAADDSTSPACESCGSFDAVEIADKFLCADCVALAGCGCGGAALVNNEEPADA